MPSVFNTCWLRNVLCATRACTFSTSQPKSGPNMWCFWRFDFKMCFAPQRRALFEHLNSKKWLGAEMLLTFWLQNAHRATATCATAALASLLFDPPGPQNIGKTRCFATFLPFRAPASSFFFLSLLWLSRPMLFHLSILHFRQICHMIGIQAGSIPLIINKWRVPCKCSPAEIAVLLRDLIFFLTLLLLTWTLRLLSTLSQNFAKKKRNAVEEYQKAFLVACRSMP